jgi:gamma-glutamyl hydrolase
MNKYFRVIATNKDENGIKFISIVESKLYPFYGVQFHPEKNA